MRPIDDAPYVQLDDLLVWSEALRTRSQELYTRSQELYIQMLDLHARSQELCFTSRAIRTRREFDWQISEP
jgi:hypothetical protein